MDGVPDDYRGENPGGYVPVNDDDDNDNGTADKDDPGQVNGEDYYETTALRVKSCATRGRWERGKNDLRFLIFDL